MNFINQVLATLIIFLSISSTYAQDTKVVVVPLLGDDISQCTAATFCSFGETTLDCPSGNKVIQCTAAAKTVFLSSSLHTGNLGGVVGADAICQGLASDAGLTGEFKAWLSGQVPGEPIDFGGIIVTFSENVSPNNRFTKSTGPYVLVDGTIVAEDYARLTSGTIFKPIDIDESGQPLLVEEGVWTNTREDGSSHNFNPPCDNFTNTVGTTFLISSNVRVGSPIETGAGWTSNDTQQCVNEFHLYCFQQ